MIRLAEAAAFLALALAVHLGVWRWAQGSGVSSGGDSGTALVSLEASSASIAELVRQWQRPPALTPTGPAPMPSPALSVKPALAATSSPTPSMPPPPMKTPIAVSPLSAPRPAPTAPVSPPHIAPAAIPEAPAPLPASFSVPAGPTVATPFAAPSAALATLRPPPMALPKPDAPPRAPPPPARPPLRKPAPKPRPAGKHAPAIAPQRATGSGRRQAGGSAGRADVATRNAARNGALMARWGARIRRSVERHKRYPRGTRASGTVLVQLSVARDGRLASLKIRRSSGDAILDKAALTAVRRARLPRAPDGLSGGQRMFNLPITFAW